MQNKAMLAILALALGVSRAQAKAVFAHFIVGNAPPSGYDVNNWKNDIAAAQNASIDGFALNIGYGDSNVAGAVANAFQAAQGTGFTLFFSFDYLGGAGGAWPAPDVISYLNNYSSSANYYKTNGKPWVSTFEGVNNVNDWSNIKAQTNAFFIPDWSSKGPSASVNTGVVDGLFQWGAWPDGTTPLGVDVDQSYISALAGKPYMMPVSPWFYTNMPGYSKNYLWRGDDLWHTRWNQIMELQPEAVEILTWNDWGESHYIGPLPQSSTEASTVFALFNSGSASKAPFNYAQYQPHDGWRMALPYLIAQYKNGGNSTTVGNEGLAVWFKENPGLACNAGGTTGNDPTSAHCQQEFSPQVLSTDQIFFQGLLSQTAQVTVTVGGTTLSNATWTSTPSGGEGIYFGSAEYGSNMGDVVVTLSRNGNTIKTVSGGSIQNCENSAVNWNAWTGSA